MRPDSARSLREHPGAIVQCPIDWLTPLLWTAGDEAKRILDLITGWGVTRFSISWEREYLRRLLPQLHEWGHEVNIYAVPDLESFLEAVVLLPCSVTSDFNFPAVAPIRPRFGQVEGRLFSYSADTN